MIIKDNGEKLKCPICQGELHSIIIFGRDGIAREFGKCNKCKKAHHF